MTAMIQNPVALRAQQRQEEGDDVALANYLTSKMRLDQTQDLWAYSQHPLADWSHPSYAQQPYYQQAQPRMHRPSSRPRTPSNNSSREPLQVQKSASTPNRQRPHRREARSKSVMHEPRPPFAQPRASSSSSTVNSERRSSITSVSSSISQTVSIRSDMSMNTKLSLSKRLRKVFSMSHLRSKDVGVIAADNMSDISIDSSQSHQPGKGFRRRSMASLSQLFQKNQQQPSQQPLEKKDARPALHVDTGTRKGALKGHKLPDSPNSVVSSRSSSFSRLPPPRLVGGDGLPSPTPSSSSSSTRPRLPSLAHDDDETEMVPPVIGNHYGLPLHGSPRLKPASSSTSSLADTSLKPRKLQFSGTIQVHETFSPNEYDRRCDSNSTCQKLTPLLAMKIKQELNEFKLTDMEVHVESRQYTHFFL
ncbi:bud neck involved protein [Apophysomyces sp. BC1034]|nr:bud neck involved protein [Apophysomyces sp. BC1015]KAG0176671.1 bud neck involved protein [Apophysomyces sp. BC1021]KAG0191823.1 bud neck involved protein [Apophysomyces sp. BC1034]